MRFKIKLNTIIMKKVVLLSILLVFAFLPAQAQLGSLIQKAASKTTSKLMDKAADTIANAASNAISRQFDKTRQNRQENTQAQTTTTEEETYASVMRQLPDLPTEQQLCSHKEAELNEQSLRLLTSAVTRFSTQVLSLSTKILTMPVMGMDSTQVTETAYRMAQLSTGMSKEEIEVLASLPEDQQEAYIKAHYKAGAYESAVIQGAEEVGKYLEPLQPLIDKWDEVGRKADEVIAQADTKCKDVYKKYASILKGAEGKERNKLLLKYYQDIVAFQRVAVKEAMRIRLEEQLPIAEEIEQQMVKIRAEHKDVVSALLNYPQLTASQYFAEVNRLLDIPEYNE